VLVGTGSDATGCSRVASVPSQLSHQLQSSQHCSLYSCPGELELFGTGSQHSAVDAMGHQRRLVQSHWTDGEQWRQDMKGRGGVKERGGGAIDDYPHRDTRL